MNRTNTTSKVVAEVIMVLLSVLLIDRFNVSAKLDL
jgi:hypothetical protein